MARTRTMTWRCSLVAVALVLGACDDDGDDGDGADATIEVTDDERPYVTALAERVEDGDAASLALDPAEADCLATRIVGVLRVERLEAAGIDPQGLAEQDGLDFSALELTEAEGGELYDAFGSCGVDVRAQFVDTIAADQDLDPADRRCLEDALDEELLRRITVTGFVEGGAAVESDPAIRTGLLEVFEACPAAVPG